MISTILIPIGIIIFLKLNKFYQFLVLSLSALLPFSFGDFRSIPSLQFIEWLTLTTFLMLINELVPTNRVEKRLKTIKFKGIEIFIFAILLLITWTIVSFVNHEILSQSFRDTGKTGTTRIYFNIFNNILLFFTTIIFVTVYFEKIDFENFFNILLTIALVLGVLKLISYFIIDFQIPLLSGAFDYTGEYSSARQAQYGGKAYRFGGLSEVVIVGIPSLFACYLYNKRLNIPGLLLLLIFLFFSGGRTVMIGTVISVTVFSFLFLPKNLIYLILIGGLLYIFAAVFLPDSLLQGQTGRLTTFNAGHFMGQDAERAMKWKFYLVTFEKNPILGKGIVEYQGYIYTLYENLGQSTGEALLSGGHGAYISLLSTFGLGGIVYFVLMVFGGIYLSFRKIKQYLNIDVTKTAIAVFVFMILIIKSIDFITSGNGLNTVGILFFIVGLVTSLTVLQNRKDIK